MRSTSAQDHSERLLALETRIREFYQSESVAGLIPQGPGVFVRETYDIWVENGGKISGRYNRNSLSRIKQALTGDHCVRSLHPKLSGQVRMTRGDTTSLLHLFLSQWRYSSNASTNSTENSEGFIPIDIDDISELVTKITTALFNHEKGRRGILLPNSTLLGIPSDEMESASELSRHLPESSVSMTISRQKTIIGHNLHWTMRTFWHLFHNSYNNQYVRDDEEYIAIWIVDLGSRTIEEKSSFTTFYNAGFLAMCFVALATFCSTGLENDDSFMYREIGESDRAKQRKFWNWFSRRCVIVVENLQEEEFIDYLDEDTRQLRRVSFRKSGITADQILPTTIPAKWAKKIREIYGKDMENLDEATLIVQIYKQINEEINHYDVKYQGFSQLEIDSDDRLNVKMYRNTDLPSPGPNYDAAMKLTYHAARYIIHREYTPNAINTEERDAYSYLTSLGFEPLTLRNFIQIFWSSVELLETPE